MFWMEKPKGYFKRKTDLCYIGNLQWSRDKGLNSNCCHGSADLVGNESQQYGKVMVKVKGTSGN